MIKQELIVKKILTYPVEINGSWWINIEYTLGNHVNTCEVMFKTEDDAKLLQVGHKLCNT